MFTYLSTVPYNENDMPELAEPPPPRRRDRGSYRAVTHDTLLMIGLKVPRSTAELCFWDMKGKGGRTTHP